MRARATSWARRTVNEVGSVVVEAEPFYRKITILVPQSDDVEFGLFDSPEALEQAIEDIDILTQDAQLPLLPSDVSIRMQIVPGQGAIARCQEGLGEISIIVEYLSQKGSL